MDKEVVEYWKSRYTKAKYYAIVFALAFLALGVALVLSVNTIENTLSVCYQLNTNSQSAQDCIYNN